MTGFVKNDNYKFNNTFNFTLLKTGKEIQVQSENIRK